MKVTLADEQATLDLGAQLAKQLPDKGIVFLHGTLGAGKTTLVRGILRAFGHKGSTKSPTYTIVEPYLLMSKKNTSRKVYHFDLYRLSEPEELEYMGIRDYFDENALCFIEWPENGKGFLPTADFEIILSYSSEQRLVELHGFE
ncbi:MAG: tRNA threonylcarbamoyladenosine biosynthesis protein TsaE [Polaribacter sp.]